MSTKQKPVDPIEAGRGFLEGALAAARKALASLEEANKLAKASTRQLRKAPGFNEDSFHAAIFEQGRPFTVPDRLLWAADTSDELGEAIKDTRAIVGWMAEALATTEDAERAIYALIASERNAPPLQGDKPTVH